MLNLIDKAPVIKKVDGKLTIYRSGSASFATSNQYQIDWHFIAHLLPYANLFLLFFLFYNNLVVTVKAKSKALNRAAECKKLSPTVRSMASAP